MLGRRCLLVGSAAIVACRGGGSAPRTERVGVWSWCDLPRDGDTHGLSAIAWDERGRTAYVVQDKHPNIVALAPDRELRTWQVGGRIQVDLAEPIDLEALALVPDGFLVASEIGPRIVEIDRAGHVRGELPVPQSLRSARENRSLESLAVSPDGRFVFVANEEAAPADGPLANAAHGTLVRIVRIDRVTHETVERPYMTERGFDDGDIGVADLTALSSTDVLVLERGWSKTRGNVARIYRAALDQTEEAKELIVDLSMLDVRALALPVPREPQPSPLLDNYEGLTLGPRLANGRRSLLLVSDDNGRTNQVARVLVLGWS